MVWSYPRLLAAVPLVGAGIATVLHTGVNIFPHYFTASKRSDVSLCTRCNNSVQVDRMTDPVPPDVAALVQEYAHRLVCPTHLRVYSLPFFDANIAQGIPTERLDVFITPGLSGL